MNYHQLGTALHKEYEAKYSLSNDIHDQAVDASNFQMKLFGVAGVTTIGILLSIISLLI